MSFCTTWAVRVLDRIIIYFEQKLNYLQNRMHGAELKLQNLHHKIDNNMKQKVSFYSICLIKLERASQFLYKISKLNLDSTFLSDRQMHKM